MEVTKSKQGAIWGNTEAERLFRAASAKQAVVRPGETRGFPTPSSVTCTAAVGVGEAGVGGGGSGSHPPVAPGSGSAFPHCSSKGFKTERMFPLPGDLHFERGARKARGGPSSLQTSIDPRLRTHHPGPHPNF